MDICLCQEENHYPNEIEALPEGWKHAEVTFDRNGEEVKKYQVIDTRSRLQYINDTQFTVAAKCSLLIVGLPFLTTLNIAINALRTPILMLSMLGGSLADFWSEPTSGRLNRCVEIWSCKAPTVFLSQIGQIVKAPFLALEMEFAAIYGLARPLEGRILVGNAERVWKGVDRRCDIRHAKEDFGVILQDFFTNPDSTHCLFIAHCFQPIAKAIEGEGRVKKIVYLDPSSKA